MSKSKYTNTANAGRLRRRGQSVPKNLLTSEDRFIDGSKCTDRLNAEGVGQLLRSCARGEMLCSPGLKQPWAGISECLRRYRKQQALGVNDDAVVAVADGLHLFEQSLV